jgi:hypothetical protein
MNCLVCGHKLAIFRKLSLGDFCCQEHRALFLKEQSDRGLARLKEANGGTQAQAIGTRVYAHFLEEPLYPFQSRTGYVGYGPLSAVRLVSLDLLPLLVPRLAAPKLEFLKSIASHPGPMASACSQVVGQSLRLPNKFPVQRAGMQLQPAGLILPWAPGAGSSAVFSLAPLAAAAWAQSGFCKPLTNGSSLMGSLRFAWPGIEGKLELAAAGLSIAPPTPAAVAAASSPVMPPGQPMRVRLATPLVGRHRPSVEGPVEPLAQPSEPEPAVGASAPAAPAKKGLFATIFFPHPRPALTARARARLQYREDTFGYDEPIQPKRASQSSAWMTMLSGWTPSAAGVSAAFAVLFLFSAITIFLSAPSTMSYRAPSFRWGSLRTAIRNRAVLKFEDDFRAGLNRWSFPTGRSQDWSYDQAGFLRPGKLGFLEQSMGLVNYRLELMGQIERKSLGWAFRAHDARNYYVAKLMIARPGPLPMVDLVHYPVLNGKEGAKVRVALPFSVRNDTLYQVEMNIAGDHFRASVNGHVVDSWSDNLLRAGGVGFVTGQGEAARVRWIRVSDRDDVLGRVCSYLSASAMKPSDNPMLSASLYMIFNPPGL